MARWVLPVLVGPSTAVTPRARTCGGRERRAMPECRVMRIVPDVRIRGALRTEKPARAALSKSRPGQEPGCRLPLYMAFRSGFAPLEDKLQGFSGLTAPLRRSPRPWP